MKLKEFITNVFGEYGSSMTNGLLYGKQLSLFIPALQQLDEFKNCILKQIEFPTYETTERLWRENNDNIEGLFYIYSISLSPVVYSMNKPLDYMVKNNCGIGPLMYDPESLTPYKEIRMRINVEEIALNEDWKNKYTKIFNDILTNPDEYTIKGEKHVVVRGNFNQVKNLK